MYLVHWYAEVIWWYTEDISELLVRYSEALVHKYTKNICNVQMYIEYLLHVPGTEDILYTNVHGSNLSMYTCTWKKIAWYFGTQKSFGNTQKIF